MIRISKSMLVLVVFDSAVLGACAALTTALVVYKGWQWCVGYLVVGALGAKVKNECVLEENRLSGNDY
jgi:hypothetical protein